MLCVQVCVHVDVSHVFTTKTTPRTIMMDIIIINVVCVQVFTPLMQFTASAVFSYMHCSCVCRTNTDDTEVRMFMCVCL